MFKEQLETLRESELGVSKQEMEEYKTKRIAARNEMIGSQVTLEKLHEDVSNLKHMLQFVLTPMVTGLIKGIESALRILNSRSVKLPTHIRSPALASENNTSGMREGINPMSSIFESADESPRSVSRGAKPLNTAKDALEQAELLREELAKSQSGITLLSQAITRLDTVMRNPNKNGCCEASFKSHILGACKAPLPEQLLR